MRSPIIIDIEASGFGAGSYPIEVGVALADGSVCSRLIRPMTHWLHWKADAEALHGISRERLLAEGCAPDQVADWLNELLAPQTAYSDAWSYDRNWLARLFHDCGRHQRFKLDSVVTLVRENELANWAACREATISRTGLVPHRAGNDALIIQQTAELVLSAEATADRLAPDIKAA